MQRAPQDVRVSRYHPPDLRRNFDLSAHSAKVKPGECGHRDMMGDASNWKANWSYYRDCLFIRRSGRTVRANL